MKNANFFPAGLLGKGDINLIRNGKFPFVELSHYLNELYCVQLGFLLYSFVHQIIIKRSDKKFVEYVLHHGLTLLYLISYSSLILVALFYWYMMPVMLSWYKIRN